MYGLIDRTTGKIASAKNPVQKWPDMAKFSAVLTAASVPPVRIRTSNGVDLVSSADEVERVLSQCLKREVMLQSQSPEVPSLEGPTSVPNESIQRHCFGGEFTLAENSLIAQWAYMLLLHSQWVLWSNLSASCWRDWVRVLDYCAIGTAGRSNN